jgi:D-cysteine desulfhydrase
VAWRKNGYWIPFGGSTSYSALGYLAAARELSVQIDKGELPQVKKIFIPFGTGGTVAGLLVGFALLGLPIKIVAVQSVEAVFANKRSLIKQVRNLLELIGRKDLLARAMDGLLRVECGYLGGGYRAATDVAEDAVTMTEPHGIKLETAFSGKAMAALIDEARIDRTDEILFWNTHDQSGVFV